MRDDEAIPFAARNLTRKEKREGDLYMYNSPKCGRRIEIISCLTMALALKFEFDVTCTTFVERPRLLSFGEHTVELSYWTRKVDGLEQFWVLTSDVDTERPRSPQRDHRHSRQIIDAARAAQISLAFVFEDDLLNHSIALTNSYRMLPQVQTAATLPNRMPLQARVRAIFDTQARATIRQIEDALHEFNAADIHAIICDLIHKDILTFEKTQPLDRLSVVQLGASA